MTYFLPGETIKCVFYEGSTGLTDSSFTKRLYKDSVSFSSTVTVSELGNGYYSAQFTASPDADAVYELALEYGHEVWLGTFPVKAAEEANIVQDNGRASSFTSQISYIKSMVDSIYRLVWRTSR